jgi:V/A-type H+/Na+-transporting ATPase subunit E
MMGMEKISEAILDKVRVEAQDIVREAEEKARERLEKAKKQREAKLEEEKNKLIQGAEGEAARILAQASIGARQELLAAKAEIIDDIINRVKQLLSNFSSSEGSPLNLIKEAINAIGIDKVRVYVSPKDIVMAQKLIDEDKELANIIVEVREFDCIGGVVVEDIDGKSRVDNTYDARLEMLLPQILPEINRELFGTL